MIKITDETVSWLRKTQPEKMISILRVKDGFDHFPYMQYIFRIVFTLRINILAISFHFPIL